jgi:hypothetical protein
LRIYVPTPNSVIRRMSMAIFTECASTLGMHGLTSDLQQSRMPD